MSFGLGFGFSRLYGALAAVFSPLSLFSAGEAGAWYDPSDLTTLFQDSAGTTPVTAVEQPVGLMRDKSGRGNHASQSTSAARPVLSARVNLLTSTVAMTGGSWVLSNVTTTANTLVAPDGTTTGELVTGTSVFGSHWRANGFLATPTTSNAFNVSISKGTQRYIAVICGDTVGSRFGCTVDTTTWQIVSSGVYASGSLTSATISQNASNSLWYDIKIVGTTSNPSVAIYVAARDSATWNGDTNAATAGGGTWYNWGFDLRVANDGVGIPAYQRVNTSTDYDTTGFPLYIKPNGSTQFMVTNSINFTATDKLTVWAGVRKLADPIGMLLEFSAQFNGANTGTFALYPGVSGTPVWTFGSKGTNVSYAEPAASSAPVTNVLTGIGNISGDVATLRINGVQGATSITDQGTGNYGTYPLYLFARGGASLWYGGRFYGLIVRGAASDATQIANGETYMNSKTKAY